MKHTELKEGDTIIELSPFRSLKLVKVSKVTSKTIQTKMILKSNIISKHGKHFGDYLYVWDNNILNEIREIESKKSELENRITELIKQLEMITIGE